MAWIAGVDGCKGGWIAVYEDTDSGKLDCRVEKTFDKVMTHRELDVVAVDMPIGLPKGLPTQPERTCDGCARKVLGKRHSSIFSAPAAGVVDLYREMSPEKRRDRNAAYKCANRFNDKLTGKGLTQQSWNLVAKISEVDDYRRDCDGAPDALHEAHPEISFAAMNAQNAGHRGFAPMRHSKASIQGLLERRNLLAREFGEVLDKFEAKAPDCKGDAAPDDFYDALACLWTARRIHKGTEGPARALCGIDNTRKLDIRKLSGGAPKGADDLTMRIVY